MTPATPRCIARSVRKAYGTNPILKGIDLEIAEGSFAVLVGPSGCGKSTLLRAIAGLESIDAGTIELAGRDVTLLPPRDRDVAMVFQSYALYPHLTVRDNLAFGLTLRNTERAIIDERIREASAMLGLDTLLDRLPKQLSGGQRQRVAMGRAVVRRASLYLFDEPLSNLDAALRAEVRVEIRKLHERIGATTLYVTHDQVEAMTLADTLWILNGGVVEQKGAPLDVYEKPASEFVASFLGSPKINLFDAKIEREGTNWVAVAEGISATLDPSAFALTEGQPVVVGIRPQDIHLETERPLGRLRVEIVEALGSEAFAHGSLGASARFLARLSADEARSTKAGTILPLTASPRHIHLFDPASRRSIRIAP